MEDLTRRTLLDGDSSEVIKCQHRLLQFLAGLKIFYVEFLPTSLVTVDSPPMALVTPSVVEMSRGLFRDVFRFWFGDYIFKFTQNPIPTPVP